MKKILTMGIMTAFLLSLSGIAFAQDGGDRPQAQFGQMCGQGPQSEQGMSGPGGGSGGYGQRPGGMTQDPKTMEKMMKIRIVVQNSEEASNQILAICDKEIEKNPQLKQKIDKQKQMMLSKQGQSGQQGQRSEGMGYREDGIKPVSPPGAGQLKQ